MKLLKTLHVFKTNYFYNKLDDLIILNKQKKQNKQCITFGKTDIGQYYIPYVHIYQNRTIFFICLSVILYIAICSFILYLLRAQDIVFLMLVCGVLKYTK
eukprot:UN03878